MTIAPVCAPVSSNDQMEVLAGTSRIPTIGLFLAVAATGYSQRPAHSSQIPSPTGVANLLLSDDPRQTAWGAHYAIASRDPALDNDLLSIAADWRPLPQPQPGDLPAKTRLTDEQLDRRDAMAAVLDALIQKNIQVPADTLSLLAPDFENYVAILLARLPLDQSQDLAFDLYRHPADPDGRTLQYISAALLAQNSPPGYAADLFSGIHVHAVVFIMPAGFSGGYGIGSSGCRLGSGLAAPRIDWPYFGIYSLLRQYSPGEFPVLAKPDPLYASRMVRTNRYPGAGSGTSLIPEDRRRFLSYMLGVDPESISWKTELNENMTFSSEPQFESDLRFFIDSLEDQYRATAYALEEKGLIAAEEEPNARPLLDIHWFDQRGEGYAALASPSALPPHVTWTKGF